MAKSQPQISVNIRMDPDLYDYLWDIHEKTDETISEVIRRLLRKDQANG